MKRLIITIVVLALFSIMPHVASAVPELQLYIEGATYDSGTDTWVLSTSGDFTLWVLGDVEKFGTIYDVKLTAAVSTSEALAGGSISLTPTTATGITDPSTPSAPVAINGLSADGAVPVMGDGSSLPTHGIYGVTGTSFYEWGLGDFTLLDSPIGDFITSYPSSFPDSGQINAYTVETSGFDLIHFDAFDHIEGANHSRYIFAPFSHDAETNKVPEPSSLLLLGSGLLGLAFWGRKRFAK